jgi:hypothetical protein
MLSFWFFFFIFSWCHVSRWNRRSVRYALTLALRNINVRLSAINMNIFFIYLYIRGRFRSYFLVSMCCTISLENIITKQTVADGSHILFYRFLLVSSSNFLLLQTFTGVMYYIPSISRKSLSPCDVETWKLKVLEQQWDSCDPSHQLSTICSNIKIALKPLFINTRPCRAHDVLCKFARSLSGSIGV